MKPGWVRAKEIDAEAEDHALGRLVRERVTIREARDAIVPHELPEGTSSGAQLAASGAYVERLANTSAELATRELQAVAAIRAQALRSTSARELAKAAAGLVEARDRKQRRARHERALQSLIDTHVAWRGGRV